MADLTGLEQKELEKLKIKTGCLEPLSWLYYPFSSPVRHCVLTVIFCGFDPSFYIMDHRYGVRRMTMVDSCTLPATNVDTANRLEVYRMSEKIIWGPWSASWNGHFKWNGARYRRNKRRLLSPDFYAQKRRYNIIFGLPTRSEASDNEDGSISWHSLPSSGTVIIGSRSRYQSLYKALTTMWEAILQPVLHWKLSISKPRFPKSYNDIKPSILL